MATGTTATSGAESLAQSRYCDEQHLAAKGTVTLSGSQTVGDLNGAAAVSLTGVTVGAVSAGDSRSVTSGMSSPTASRSIAGETWKTVGVFTATGATVSGGVIGYSKVTLDNTKVLSGGVGRYDEYEEDGTYGFGSSVISYGCGSKHVYSRVRLAFDAESSALTSQSVFSAFAYAPTVTLTLRNGAQVTGDLNGIRKFDLAAGTTVDGNAAMDIVSSTYVDTVTSNGKTGMYEEKTYSSFRQKATGTVTLTGSPGAVVKVCGDISGAGRITAADVIVGDLVNSCAVSSAIYTGTGSSVDPVSSGAAVWSVTSPTTSISINSSVESASGRATLTRTSAGRIVGYATVKATDGEIVGASAGKGKMFYVETETDQEEGSILSLDSESRVQRAFIATDTKITGSGGILFGSGGLSGFAKVDLTRCRIASGAAVVGGNTTMTMTMSGGFSGMTFSTTFAAAGRLTAKDTDMTGVVVSNYAKVTLTDCTLGGVVVGGGGGIFGGSSGSNDKPARAALILSGENELFSDGGSGGIGGSSGGSSGGSGGSLPFGNSSLAIDGISNVTVKDGLTQVLGGRGGYNGTGGNDTVAVKAKAELDLESGMSFGDGKDSLAVKGTLRVGGDFDAENLEKLSGSGMLALADAGAEALRAAIDSGTTKLSGRKLNIVAAGTKVEDVFSVRTRQEENADNEAAAARKFERFDLYGWLSGVEDAASWKFADTVDWIDFSYEEGRGLDLTLTDADRGGDVRVDIWQSGEAVQENIGWTSGKIDISSLGLATGDYQLKLSIADGAENNSALSYSLAIPAFG